MQTRVGRHTLAVESASREGAKNARLAVGLWCSAGEGAVDRGGQKIVGEDWDGMDEAGHVKSSARIGAIFGCMPRLRRGMSMVRVQREARNDEASATADAAGFYLAFRAVACYVDVKRDRIGADEFKRCRRIALTKLRSVGARGTEHARRDVAGALQREACGRASGAEQLCAEAEVVQRDEALGGQQFGGSATAVV